MATRFRTINVRPELFTDDRLADIPPEARLFYMLMWSARDHDDVVDERAIHDVWTTAQESFCDDTIAVMDCINALFEIGYIKRSDFGTRVLDPNRSFAKDSFPFARHARMAAAAGSATADAIASRIEYYGRLCWICRTAPYEAIDHVKPIRHGGSNWPANLRPACKSCNSRKGSKWPFSRTEIAT